MATATEVGGGMAADGSMPSVLLLLLPPLSLPLAPD